MNDDILNNKGKKLIHKAGDRLKPMIEVPFSGMMISVRGYEGNHYLLMHPEKYGQCLSCTERVFFCREKPQDQYIPVKFNQKEVHACEGEIKRNKALRRILYGPESNTR